MNSVNLVGRLTRDVELRRTQAGKAVASFTLAVNRINGEADFINCTAWDKQAEVLEKYTAKGSMVGVAGRLQVEKYEQNGQSRTAVKVVASAIDLCDKKEQFTPTSEPDPFNDERLPF